MKIIFFYSDVYVWMGWLDLVEFLWIGVNGWFIFIIIYVWVIIGSKKKFSICLKF